MRLRRATRVSNRSGFTLVETMMSILIIAMFFSTILLGYTRATQRAQWSGYALAAQAQGLKQMEEFRAVLWDTQSTPVVDDTVNIPSVLVLPLDLTISGSNVVYATKTATVTTITNFGNNSRRQDDRRSTPRGRGTDRRIRTPLWITGRLTNEYLILTF